MDDAPRQRPPSAAAHAEVRPGARAGRTTRPAVAFLAWSSVAGRSDEIARALGGEAHCAYPLRIARRSLLPLRYALSALQTLAYLVRRRPRAVIVTNPPVFPALVAFPYARLTGAPLLLDSHPDAFRDDGPHAPFLRLHAWLARRARATLVTTDELAQQVDAWGGTPLVVHEPTPDWSTAPPAPLGERPFVLVLGSLSTDEPVEEALAAARALPEVAFGFTGDTRRLLPELRAAAPANVSFLGFLDPAGYRAALERASVAVVLTTWLRWAVPRSAYDAVYARRPLVLSSSPVLRELFPFAVAVDNEPTSIEAGIRDAVSRFDELCASTEDALALQTERWHDQREGLRAAVARA